MIEPKSIEVREQLELVPLSEEHLQELHMLIEKNRAHLKEWLGWLDSTKSIDDTRTFLKGAISDFIDSGRPTYSIFFRGELVGLCSVNSWSPRNHLASIGYWLSKEHGGKGIMTDCVSIIVNLCFDDLKVNKIEINCAKGNHKSQAIPRRLGFKEEGLLRQREFLYDRYVDHIVFGLLKSER